jgi:hypothetical protein
MDCTGGTFGCGGTSDTTTDYLPPFTGESCPFKVGNPVNITSGGKAYQKTDMAIDTPAGKLVFSRTYNSMAGNMGVSSQNKRAGGVRGKLQL